MPFFPTSVPTLVELLDAKNNTEIVLDGAIDNIVTTIIVDDTSNIPAAGRLTFGDDASFETVSYTGKTATSITGVARGVDGTSAASHLDNALLGVFQSARYHNILSEEINAIAQNLSDRIGLSATRLLVPDGTFALPSYGFASDLDAGMYLISAAIIGMAGLEFRLQTDGCFYSLANTAGTSRGFLQAAESTSAGMTLQSNQDTSVMRFITTGLAPFIWLSNSIERMRLDTSGNLGIGIATPDGTLHVHTATAGAATADSNADDLVVENSGNCGITILTPNSNLGIIYFADVDDVNIGQITYDHSTDLMKFVVNNSGRLSIDSVGNVGIGTQTFGGSAAGVLTIFNGTQGAALANSIQIVSEDLTAGNTQISLQTEGTIVGSGTPTQDKTLAIKVNGTQYYIHLSTVAS